MSDSEYNTIGWSERHDAYADMPRVWRESPGSLRELSEQASALVESLRKHPVWRKVDALRRVLSVTDRYDELPAPLDRGDLEEYASGTERCRRELVEEIEKLRGLVSELGEVAEHAKWAAEKPASLDED